MTFRINRISHVLYTAICCVINDILQYICHIIARFDRVSLLGMSDCCDNASELQESVSSVQHMMIFIADLNLKPHETVSSVVKG